MIEIVTDDLLAQSVEALVIPIDGTLVPNRGQFDFVLGNLGRQLIKCFPDLEFLDEIRDQIRFPLGLGRAAPLHLPEPPEPDSPLRSIILVSILYHAGYLAENEKRALIREGFTQVLAVAARLRVRSLGTPVLQGGWRLSLETAFTVMVEAHRACCPSPTFPVRLCCLDEATADRLLSLARTLRT